MSPSADVTSIVDLHAFEVQQKLVFPTPTATAYTIQSLHATSTPSARRTASKKINIIGTSFVFALFFKTVSAYVPGLLWDWHVFWWLSQGLGISGLLGLESWGWWIGSSSSSRLSVGLLTATAHRIHSRIPISWSSLRSQCIVELHGWNYPRVGNTRSFDRMDGSSSRPAN